MDCEQTARIYQKLGAIYYFEGTNFPKLKQYLRDSTLLKWKNCDLVKANQLWDPGFYLLHFFIIKNRLDDAKTIYNIINTTEGVQEGIEGDWIMDYYIQVGSMYAKMGDKISSQQNFEKALSLIDELQLDSYYSFPAYNSYAFSLFDFKEYERSEAMFELARKNVYDPLDELLVAVNYSNVYIHQKRFDESLDLLMRVKTIADTTSDVRMKPTHLGQLGKTYLGLGQLDQASFVLDSAITQFKKIKDKGHTSLVLSLKAKVEDKKGNRGLSDQLFKEAIYEHINEASYDIFSSSTKLYHMPILDYEYLLLVLKAYLDVCVDQFHITKSEEDLIRILEIIDQLTGLISRERSHYISEYSKLEQLKDNYAIYEKGIESCLLYHTQTHDDEYLKKAFELSAKNKSSVLTSLQNINILYDKFLPEKLCSKITKLETAKRDLESILFDDEISNKDSLNKEYVSLTEEMKKMNFRISQEYPEVVQALSSSKTNFNFETVLNNIPKHTSLINIFCGEEAIYLFMISGGKISVDKVLNTPMLRKKFEVCSNSLKNYNEQSQYLENSKELFNILYKNSFSRLNDNYTTIIMSDGYLQNIPVEALWMGEEFVVEKYTISYCSGLTQLLNSANEDLELKSYLGFGTKYSKESKQQSKDEYRRYTTERPMLEHSEREITSCKEWFDSKTFIGSEATKANFLEHVTEEEGIIHTALHGLFLDENTSALLFDSKSDEMLLSSNEVYDLRLHNELTILSACYTAGGKTFEGEGNLSLMRSFLYAGSKNIISSLWSASEADHNFFFEESQ